MIFHSYFIDPNDYIGGTQLITNPPSSTTICATYTIRTDNVVEDNERFEVIISDLLPTGVTGLTLGEQIKTEITIIDSSKNFLMLSYISQ